MMHSEGVFNGSVVTLYTKYMPIHFWTIFGVFSKLIHVEIKKKKKADCETFTFYV